LAWVGMARPRQAWVWVWVPTMTPMQVSDSNTTLILAQFFLAAESGLFQPHFAHRDFCTFLPM
jgi:hypothetical protein